MGEPTGSFKAIPCMGSVNYIDLKETPKALADWPPMLASNAAHLAHSLEEGNVSGKRLTLNSSGISWYDFTCMRNENLTEIGIHQICAWTPGVVASERPPGF